MKKKATPGTALIALAISLAAILGFLGFGLGLLYLGNWMMEVSEEEVWELPPMVSVAMELPLRSPASEAWIFLKRERFCWDARATRF